MAATEGSTDASPRERWAALAAAALALPGMPALAADPNLRSDQVVLSYHHANYDETGGRMAVRTDQLSISAPLGERYELKLNTVRDITSGASVFSYIAVQGKPMALKTGATIHDKRTVVDVTGSYYGDEHFASLNVGHSVENDYKADFVNATYRRMLNDKATTLSLAAGYSNDTTWEKYYPLQLGSVPEVFRKRQGLVLLAGVSQIIDTESVGQFYLGRTHNQGWLDDQYRKPAVIVKFVPTFFHESRPEHTQWTALARYSHYFAALKSALHVDYRYASDSWGADSHTLEAKWRYAVGNGWTLAPGLRYYKQKNADFYGVYWSQIPSNGQASSDARLSAFHALSAKFEVLKSFSGGSLLRLSYEQYERKQGGGRGDAIDNYRSRTLSSSFEYPF